MSNEQFVRAYADAWAGKGDLASLWDPGGCLIHPTLSRPIAGCWLAALNEHNRNALPDLNWRLLDWFGAKDRVCIEWECKATINGTQVVWRGIDKFLLRDGLIYEEVVYSDTLPLWSALDPTMVRPPMVDADFLEQQGAEGDGS